MELSKKKILIVDDAIFCRICAALLEKEGYKINVVPDVFQVDLDRNHDELGLVITSYPYGAALLGQLQRSRIPTIILSDQVCHDLTAALDHFDKSLSHCLIKPLDYHKFRMLVGQAMSRGVVRDN